MAKRRRRKGLFGNGVKLLGKVDLLGLNQFGQNPGMSPLVGVAIGGGASVATQFLASRMASTAAKAETYGLLGGLAATGALYAMKRTRHAALGAAAGTLLAAGIPWLKRKMGLAGLGVPQIRYLNGLGVHQVDYLNGLGVHTAEPTRTPYGTIPGVHGLSQAGIQMGPDAGRPPVDLLGQNAASEGVRLLGGPQVSGLASQFGATIFGGSR